ncbi:MAG: cyclic nucleotide-binding domain-containing protein, partial [Planctomycetota bacterium]
MDDKKTYEPLLDIENVLPILNKITIFAGLSDPQLYKLSRLLSSVSYKANETVFEQGDEPGNIYIVKKGKVKLVIWEDGIPLELIVF